MASSEYVIVAVWEDAGRLVGDVMAEGFPSYDAARIYARQMRRSFAEGELFIHEKGDVAHLYSK